MILLQNPSIPVATNAIEIDAAIIDIQSHLDSGLLWLTNGYGRAYKNVDTTQGNTVYYPEVYLGTQNNSQRYTNISPDNDKQGQNFFFVTKETISQFQPGMHSFLTYDTAIIFSVNMELINSALLGTEIYQQILVAQVRDVLTRQLLGSSYQLKINSVDLLFDNVFSEFDLKDAEQLEKAPLSHFRFNCSITLPEICPTPVIIPDPVTVGLSLWLKADAGVNGGTALDGHAVYEWADQSGNGNNFVQSIAIGQPIYNTSGINSIPSITFDLKRLELLSALLLGTDYTIYTVFRTTANATATPYKPVFTLSNHGYYSQGDGRVGMTIDNGYTNFYYDDRAGIGAIIPHDALAHYFTISNGNVAGTDKKQIYADGINYIDASASIDSSELAHYIGSWNNQHGNFQMSELLCYTTKHTTIQQNKVQIYLKTKYAL